jgi:glucokinase
MSQTLVAIDVGASRTRVRVGADPTDFHGRGDPLIREIRSGTELSRLLSEVREGLEVSGPVHLSAGLAAPPLGGGVREMTNWPRDRQITVDGLRALGFDQVTLLNDLEAAAHGLTAFLENEPSGSQLLPTSGSRVRPDGTSSHRRPGTPWLQDTTKTNCFSDWTC